MNKEREELGARTAKWLRDYSDRGVAGFDADDIAAKAMADLPRRGWPILATVAAALLAAVVGLAVVNSPGVNPPGGQVEQRPSGTAPEGSDMPSDPPPSMSGTGISRDAAIAAAREAVPRSATWEVRVANFGTAGDLLYAEGGYQIARGLPGDRQVWVVVLGTGSGFEAEGSIVVIDYLDGTIYEVVDWIS
jgi:hypothetical protein